MSDLPAFHGLQSRPDVTRFLYWDQRTLEQAAEMLGRVVGMTRIGEDADALRLAVLLADDDSIIGDFSLWRTSREHAQAEIGFILHPDHQGRGYATEAAGELLRIAFSEAGFHRIVGRCDARNTPSATLMERLGMRREGYLRENEFVKGEWTDELVYAILAERVGYPNSERARVEEARGVQGALDGPHGCNVGGTAVALQPARLGHANAVLRAHRPAERDGERQDGVVDGVIVGVGA